MALSYQNYTGDSATTQFSIPFTYQDTAEISVTVDGVAQTGLTFPSSSTVQLTSAPASGTLVQVRRTTDLTARAVDFASGSVLTEEDLDDSNIQVFHAAQESTDLAGDSIQLGNDNKWDAQSSVIKNVGTPTVSTDAATKGYTDTEVSGVVSSAVSQATTAAVSAANTAVATATGSIIPDATKLAIHPIGTQYTLSDGVTTDYSSKHYANVASTNATTATNAASAASTDATTASTAATDAQTAQAAAEAALDTFDDRFLGAKASDPSVDNDGNALLDGAIYFNTTSDIMKVYDQANTIWRDLALTGTDQTNVNLVAGQISPTNNIGTVAGISADITTTAANDANITTVATDIANVNAVGTDIANVNTVATNLTDINSFANTYSISATAPTSPTEGDLWFDTTNDIMKVYDGSGFVNAGSSVNGTSERQTYTATSGQTSFAATYDAGYVDVYLNGVKLINGTDFTATDGSNVVLTTGAALNDTVDIVAFGTFDVTNVGASLATLGLDNHDELTVDASGNLDVNGTITFDGGTTSADINFGDNDKAIFGAGSDLQIYHDGSQSYIKDVGTGQLRIAASDILFSNAAVTENIMFGAQDGAVTLYHNGASKLATTATGVDAINTAGSSTSRFGSTYNTGSNDGTLVIGNGGSGKAMLRFDYEGTNTDRARIGVSSSGQQLEFYTAGDNERMRIDSSGNLLVGTTSNTPGGAANTTGVALSSGSYGGLISATRDSGAVADFNRKTNDGGIVQFRKDGSIVGSIGTLASNLWIGTGNTALRFGYAGLNAIVPWNTTTNSLTDGTTSLGYSSTRFTDLYLSGGVYLGGTGSANKLDDYEEGTWTPVIQDSSGNSSSSTATSTYYTKIGRQVTVTCVFTNIDTTGLTPSNNLQISGLPYQANGSSVGCALVSYLATLSTDQTNSVYSYLPNNASYLYIYEQRRLASSVISDVSYFSSGLADISLTHTYFTD
jgi:hypothetical protein